MNVPLEMTDAVKEQQTTKYNILLVDDDPAIRQILLRLLTEENYVVVTAANGAEALVLCGSAKFDLVLLDLNMPVKNGWETFEQMASKNPMLPIILITARPNQFFQAMAAGVGALMEKPLDLGRLFQIIRDLLEESQEDRLARLAGRSTTFSYVPSLPDQPAKHAFLKS
jgi:DNA-binding NtrC family response regulator